MQIEEVILVRSKDTLYRTLSFIACGICLLFVLGLTIRPLTEHNIWTDLSIGREIVTTKTIPQQDTFSFATSGQKWVDENWLYQVVMYLLYSMIGLSGLLIFKGLCITWVAYLYIRLSYKRGFNPAITAVILAASMFIFRDKWLLRAQTFGILFYLIELYCLRQYQATRKNRYLWCFPLLMLVWVNVHFSFFFGIVTLGVFFIIEAIKKYMRQRQGRWFGRTFRWKQLIGIAFVLAISLIATLFNPYGKAIYSHCFQSPSVTMLYCVMDWISFERVFMLNLPLLILPAFTFLSMFFVPTRKSDITDGVLMVVMFPIGYALKRFTIFPFILTLALSIKYIGAMINMMLYELEDMKRSLRVTAFTAYGLICIAAVVFFAGQYIYANGLSEFMNPNPRNDFNPKNAIEYMKENEVKANIYAPFYYGGYMLFQMYPEYKNFIDYRTLSISEMVLLDELKIRRAELGWEWIVDKYNINTLLLHYEPGQRYILQKRDQFHEKVMHSPDWRLAYFDDKDMVFVRSHYEIHSYDRSRLYLYYDPENIWDIVTSDALRMKMIQGDLERRLNDRTPSAWAHLALGIISLRQGLTDEAEAYIAKACSIKPKDKKLYLYQVLFDWQKQGAPLPLEEHTKFYGKQYENHLQVAFTLMVMGYYTEAEAYLENLVNDNSETYKAYVYLGICRDKLGKYVDSLEAFQKALIMKPSDTMIVYYLAKCYMNNEIYDQAVKKIRDAIQFDQNNYLYWYALAEAYYYRGNYDDSMRMCRKAVKIRPHFVEPWYLAGDLYRKLNMYDNSLEVLNKAMILEPFSQRIYLSLAITYLEKKEYGEAIENFKHVNDPLFELDPEYWFTRARIASWQGELEQALEYLGNAVELGGDDIKDAAPQTLEFNALLSEPKFQKLIQ